jgi:hypothetical protein
MNNYTCYICPNILIINTTIKYTYDPNIHIIICNICRKNIPLYSNSFCTKSLLLSNDELLDIKFVYNPNNKKKLYIESDIKSIIHKKYNTTILKDIRHRHKLSEIDKRRAELKQTLFDYKLEYNEFGLSFLYINFGQIDITSVIDEQIKIQDLKIQKRMYLIELFKRNNLIYNDKMRSCYEFIHDISNRSEEEILQIAEIENFLMESTNYLSLLSKYEYIDARDIALKEYVNNTNQSNKNLDKYIETIVTVNFH